MTEYEFVLPDFLEGNTAEEIQERMMTSLPADIDAMPGGFPYDFTMPTAIEKAELIHFYMQRLLMLAFPQFAWGEWLDLHWVLVGLKRREASFASGFVFVKGEPGVLIPKGYVFCVPASGDIAAIEFIADESIVIQDSITIVSVVAAEAGKKSNVMANTITMLMKPIKGIANVLNEEAMTGGTETESDEVFRERIMEAYAAKGTSFVGNIGDYTRWAKEVSGVGGVTIIPTWDGPGTVKIIVVDEMGQPANDRILQAVYDHIMCPDNLSERKAPIGVLLSASPPEAGTLNYSAVIEFSENTSIEEIRVAFIQRMTAHYSRVKLEGVLRYTKVCSLLSETPGVIDYRNLQVNGGMNNVTIPPASYPVTGTVEFMPK